MCSGECIPHAYALCRRNAYLDIIGIRIGGNIALHHSENGRIRVLRHDEPKLEGDIVPQDHATQAPVFVGKRALYRCGTGNTIRRRIGCCVHALRCNKDGEEKLALEIE